MSIQTLQNNKRLYNFIMDKQERKDINFLMKNNYSGDLMFNGILPLEIEVFILDLNGYKYDWDTFKLNNPILVSIKRPWKDNNKSICSRMAYNTSVLHNILYE
tara:strand:- start:173 stop:481 length:309 start_codon:yes stop_codon:yes gene_type:complete